MAWLQNTFEMTDCGDLTGMDGPGLGSDLLQYTISGAHGGADLCPGGIGYNIVYNVTEIINFAQGEFVMLGGLFAVFFVGTLHLPLVISFSLRVATAGVFGFAMERFVIRNARSTSVMSLIIITLAVSIMLKGTAMLWWGKDPYSLPAFSPGGPLLLGGAAIQRQALWVLAVSMLVVFCLTVFFRRSIYGKAMLACATIRAPARNERNSRASNGALLLCPERGNWCCRGSGHYPDFSHGI